jgi:hypothetical protein
MFVLECYGCDTKEIFPTHTDIQTLNTINYNGWWIEEYEELLFSGYYVHRNILFCKFCRGKPLVGTIRKVQKCDIKDTSSVYIQT